MVIFGLISEERDSMFSKLSNCHDNIFVVFSLFLQMNAAMYTYNTVTCISVYRRRLDW
jgi:hypothetical protein